MYALGTHNVQSTFKAETASLNFANSKKYYWKEITQYSTSPLHVPKQKQLIQRLLWSLYFAYVLSEQPYIVSFGYWYVDIINIFPIQSQVHW